MDLLAVDLRMNHTSGGGYFVTKSKKCCFISYGCYDGRKQELHKIDLQA